MFNTNQQTEIQKGEGEKHEQGYRAEVSNLPEDVMRPYSAKTLTGERRIV